MEMLAKVKTMILAMDTQQALIALCLLLVGLMLAALMLMHRRTQQAERHVREMTKTVSEQLAAADERARESSE